MKLVMTLLVRDEEDIVRANLEYHYSRGIDYVIATDNLSQDGTRDILNEYYKRGVLYYIQEKEDIYAQARWVNRMVKMAQVKFEADWVINNDADEFWWPEKRDLKSILSSLPNSILAAEAKRVNFLPLARDDISFFADTMIVREVESLNPIGKPLPPKRCHRALTGIKVNKGSHVIFKSGEKLYAPSIPVTIFHFPLRTYKKFAEKIKNTGSALPEKGGKNRKWAMWYYLWQAGALEDYYDTQVLDKAAIQKGIKAGKYILDVRLRDYVKRINNK